jgi:hypothetical protein
MGGVKKQCGPTVETAVGTGAGCGEVGMSALLKQDNRYNALRGSYHHHLKPQDEAERRYLRLRDYVARKREAYNGEDALQNLGLSEGCHAAFTRRP